jgi:hypothetical protein
MTPEVAIALFNIILLGSIGAIHWASVKYGTEYTKLPEFARKLNVLLFLWVIFTDLAYLLKSRVFTLLSLFFWVILLVFTLRNREVLGNRFEVDSKKPCAKITVRTLLSRKDYSCLIELARRTSVDFAVMVWYLAIVAILVPIFFVILYAFFWVEGITYSVTPWEILGYSLFISALAILLPAFLIRKELIKIRVREFSESQLP